MMNITAFSGELVYPESGTYGKNETKCWSITVPDTYYGIRYRFFQVSFPCITLVSNMKPLRLTFHFDFIS